MAHRWLALLVCLAAGPVAACSLSPNIIDAVVAETNALRAQERRTALRISSDLNRAAQAHACDMAARREMTHTGSNGSSVGDRVRATGYAWRFVAENVAYGYGSPQAVVSGWQGSRGHRRNMLSRDAAEIGIGVWEADGRLYWAMVLGSR